jgi:hypothetical protein
MTNHIAIISEASGQSQKLITMNLAGKNNVVFRFAMPAGGLAWFSTHAYLDQCEIQVDRGDGKGFILLTYDTTPGYNDTQPFPATPMKWTYKAIYRVNDAQVGLWSNPVTITVGG